MFVPARSGKKLAQHELKVTKALFFGKLHLICLDSVIW
jgi:hypothetical protein